MFSRTLKKIKEFNGELCGWNVSTNQTHISKITLKKGLNKFKEEASWMKTLILLCLALQVSFP